jgi:hypothetical protein
MQQCVLRSQAVVLPCQLLPQCLPPCTVTAASCNLTQHAKFSSSTINKCMPFCNGELHTMHVVSQTFDCWCMTLIPDESARLPAAACSSGGNGVAVFYRFKGRCLAGITAALYFDCWRCIAIWLPAAAVSCYTMYAALQDMSANIQLCSATSRSGSTGSMAVR